MCLGSKWQTAADHSGTASRAPPQFLAQEFRSALGRTARGKISFARLGHPVIAPESAGAVGRDESKGMLRMVARLAVAGRHRLLFQALEKGAGGRVSTQKARDRIGGRLAGDPVPVLRAQERQEILRRPRRKPFD